MIDDPDDLAIWRARTARTCRCCGCKSVVAGRCTICGAAKVVAGEPWKVSTNAVTPTTNATTVPVAASVVAEPSTAAEAWIAPRAMVVADVTPMSPAEPVAVVTQQRPSVAKVAATWRPSKASKTEQEGFGF